MCNALLHPVHVASAIPVQAGIVNSLLRPLRRSASRLGAKEFPMKVILWIIGIIFLIGLLVVVGLGGLIF